MKKTIFYAILIALIPFMSSCNQSERVLKEALVEMNAMCPIDAGMVGEISGVSYDSDLKQVKFSYLIDETFVPLEFYSVNTDLAKQSGALVFSANETKKFLQYIADANASLVAEYESKQTGSMIQIEFSNQEIEEIIEKEYTDKERAQLLFDIQFQMTKSMLPMRTDDFTIFSDVKVEDGAWVYCYEIEAGSLYALMYSMMEEEEIKSSFAESFSSDPTFQMLFRMLSDLDMGLKYSYLDSNGNDLFEASFTPDELRQYLE